VGTCARVRSSTIAAPSRPSASEIRRANRRLHRPLLAAGWDEVERLDDHPFAAA
jgi:hypothetical protein